MFLIAGRSLAVGSLVLALSGCTGATAILAEGPSPSPTSSPDKRFKIAAQKCGITGAIGDNAKSLSFDTPGEDDYGEGDELEKLVCVLGRLSVPDYVMAHIESTRALDGQQTDEWDGIQARWTYHPDDGLALTLVDTQF